LETYTFILLGGVALALLVDIILGRLCSMAMIRVGVPIAIVKHELTGDPSRIDSIDAFQSLKQFGEMFLSKSNYRISGNSLVFYERIGLSKNILYRKGYINIEGGKIIASLQLQFASTLGIFGILALPILYRLPLGGIIVFIVFIAVLVGMIYLYAVAYRAQIKLLSNLITISQVKSQGIDPGADDSAMDNKALEP
jgi:hypothetical protein